MGHIPNRGAEFNLDPGKDVGEIQNNSTPGEPLLYPGILGGRKGWAKV